MYICSMTFVDIMLYIKDLIVGVFNGLYYIIHFIFDLIVYSANIIKVLPNEVSTIMISIFTISFVVVVYKAIKL